MGPGPMSPGTGPMGPGPSPWAQDRAHGPRTGRPRAHGLVGPSTYSCRLIWAAQPFVNLLLSRGLLGVQQSEYAEAHQLFLQLQDGAFVESKSEELQKNGSFCCNLWKFLFRIWSGFINP